ncbi:transmembrane protein 256 homolog isoform X1 [Diorhabda sublineata]|uniref:transmembrane protein 256 homolog isoform X1 n=1 Tax=Diorhabda sublineata TaxID=1163346 RepID=UPI0024E0C501|nr:transmembrane protein 256 homolog isoform X1 [Diorhabda sublineata]
MVGFNDVYNYVLFDNPVSKSTISLLKGKTFTTSSTAPSVTIITEKTPLWKLAAENGPYIKIGGLMGASAIALSAYGAHKSYPKDQAEELRHIFETANRIHLIHSVAILGVPMCRYPKIVGSLLVVGTALFSGTLYYHAFSGKKRLSKVAPLGGTLLILGWLSMVV